MSFIAQPRLRSEQIAPTSNDLPLMVPVFALFSADAATISALGVPTVLATVQPEGCAHSRQLVEIG
jgi:hypothetical protein